MKRIISLLLVIAMILGCTCTSMAATTKSVTYNHNFFDKYVQKKLGIGMILNGVPVADLQAIGHSDTGTLEAARGNMLFNVNGSICVNKYWIMPILAQLGDMTHYYTLGDSPEDWITHGKCWKDSGSWEEPVQYHFSLFGKNWGWYKQYYPRKDGFTEERIGWLNLDTGDRWEWPRPYTFDEGLHKYKNMYPYAQPEDFVKIAPVLRYIGYNVTWSKEYNSICITSPDYTGPVTPELSAEDKKILDWAVETGYVIPDANGNVDYSEAVTDRYLFRYFADRYGIENIKRDVRNVLATRDHSLPLSMHLGPENKYESSIGDWYIEYGNQYVDGFTLKYQRGTIYTQQHTKPWVDVPVTWPEDELGSKYIYVWLMTYQGHVTKADKEKLSLGNTFAEGYYNRNYYSAKKAGLDEFGSPCQNTTELSGFILSAMEFIDPQREVDWYNFWNQYQQPKFFEYVKKYTPGPEDWSYDYKVAPLDIVEFLTWDPLANWFFKGTDWQKKTKLYAQAGHSGLEDWHMITVLDYAKIAYGWYHIDYVSDSSQWDSAITKYFDQIFPVMAKVWKQRDNASHEFWD